MSNQNDRKTAGITTAIADPRSKSVRVVELAAAELAWATEKFPPFHSAHEGYSVILEELDELWDTIKNNKTTNAIERAEEALQVAAMALRYVVDLLSAGGIDVLAASQRMKGR